MTRQTQGTIALIIAGFATFFGTIGPEIQQMQSFAEMTTPYFVGLVIVQVGAVLSAFAAGQLFRTARIFKHEPSDER